MKNWKQFTFVAILAIVGIAFIGCQPEPTPDNSKTHTHDWGEWIVTKEPSLTEEGEETRTCKLDPSHIEKRSIPKLVLYENINDIIEYLTTQTGGNNVNNPIPLFVAIPLGTMTDQNSGWQLLLNALSESDKYVSLNLSGCTGIEEFDPGTANTGEKMIASLILPNTATKIVAGTSTNATFVNFTSLKEVTGLNVTDIGMYAFIGCTSLENASFPEATSIGGYAFSGCTGLTEISFPASVTIDWYNPFNNCSSLTNFNLIGTGNLSAIENGKALYSSGAPYPGLLAYPSASGSIVMETVTQLGDFTFMNCTNLIEASFPAATGGSDNGWDVFSDCTNLIKVSIPLITRLDTGAFYNCTSLVSITLGTIAEANFRSNDIFTQSWNLREVYFGANGGAGTYTREAGSNIWTKQ
jgi:hypothetical protein